MTTTYQRALTMDYPLVGSPMTDAVVCVDCCGRLGLSGRPVTGEVMGTRPRYCDECKKLLTANPDE
jgi:hypothetical protein